MKQKRTTLAPVQAGDCSGQQPEFGRVADVTRIFGVRRGTLYNLLRHGKIRGVLLRSTGAKSGIRLIDLASVREYICACRNYEEVA